MLPDAGDVARSRIRFLTDDLEQPHPVRGIIAASWRRSRDLDVAADRVRMPYVRDPDVDTPLTRSAGSVLRALVDRLDGQSVSIILTDQSGLVLSRLSGDATLERHLDGVLLAPGFSYAEEYVGTNGIGTALEVGGPAHVFGHEHFAENLEDLACAGVPIHHPVTGRTVGAVDLTCWRRDAGSLLLTLAKTTADQIRQELLADAGGRQLALLTEYLRVCHRHTGIVLAVSGDTVMSNDDARTLLGPADQAALVGQARDALADGRRGSVAVRLPSGRGARMYCRSVGPPAEPVGVVVRVKPDEPETASTHSPPSTARGSGTQMVLPGLVGSAPLWLRACREVERVFQAGEWLAVQGEPGVGKLALLRAVQLRRQPVGRFAVLDAADAGADWWTVARRTLVEDADSVAIQHVDRLDAAGLRALSAALRVAAEVERERRLWVAVTLGDGKRRGELARFLRLFPSTVEVPPLRLHAEDLPALVSFILARLGHGGQLTCSPAAMQLLARATWPGNVEQLSRMLRQVVQHRRSGSIQVSDLPPEASTVSRRKLSPLESLERDAIVRSLADASGNKVQAARSLGVSRATIYRKIHEYGIVAPTD